MKITVRELKSYIRNAMAPGSADREAIDDVDSHPEDLGDEMAPHLRYEPLEPEEDYLGPVPPTNDGDFYAVMDPYHSDFHVIPHPRFSR